MSVAASKYEKQRDRQIPPHAPLGAVRKALGLRLDDVLARIRTAYPGTRMNRGTLSAIESGTRGASDEMLDVLCLGYGLPAGSLTTTYVPRTSAARSAA